MSVELKNNKVLNYFMVLISLFIVVLFTSGQFVKLQENKDVSSQLENEIQEVRKQLEKLEDIKKQITQSWASTQRYLTQFSEDEILDYLYTYQETSNNAQGNLQITSINLSQGVLNDYGFYEKEIMVEAIVSDEMVMMTFLDYLVAEDAKYRFFIEGFSYPNDDRQGGYNIAIPLKIFYR